MKFGIACLAAVALAAGSANGAFFSFASGSASGAWTFTGNGATFASGLGDTPVRLLIDDDLGANPTLEVSALFTSSITLSHIASTPMGGGLFAHNYAASGTFMFVDAVSAVPLLTTTFTGGLFSAIGGEASWSASAAFQASGPSVAMVWSGANLPQYGLTPGPLDAGSFAFGLSALNTSGSIPYNFQNPGAPLGGNSLPSTTWYSSASYTAAAIPTPGSAAGLLLAGAFAARRRRR
jgi:hypothetical protein